MVLSGFFGRYNLASAEVVFSLPDEVYAGTEFPLAVTLRNRRLFFPIFLMKVHIKGRELLFPFVEAGREETRHVQWEFEHRGRYRISDISICSVFPFSFFTRCRGLPAEHNGVVFAQPKQCALFQGTSFSHRRMQGERSLDSAGFDAEAISVRDYVPGDPLKHIHWKATARTGTLKTKELAALVHAPVVVEFDRVQIESIEERISCITGFILQLHRRGTPVGLSLGDRLFKPSVLQTHKRAMLRELALYGSE
ncbi:MAG: hypothetical protein FD164_674 [Nitrospirae bacterium]|nr:MAG: hypothetical protein FD164_674 [Nitrospirota bacterium]